MVLVCLFQFYLHGGVDGRLMAAVSGNSPEVLERWAWWWQRLQLAGGWKCGETCTKQFVPRFKKLAVQGNYECISDKQFWEDFPKNYVCPAKPSINHVELMKLAEQVGVGSRAQLGKIAGWAEKGVEIGCRGRFRAASVAGNTKGAYVAGAQVTDAVASWVEDGLVYGPVEEEDVPANAKINSILTRPKPNGTVRIILNLSAPEGCSVNDGINIEEFPAVMSSTEAWLAVLNAAGRDCWMVKVDWQNAYKHLTVQAADTDLQWFMWGGKFFKELCLVFGASSSAGIFDALAKLVLELVCRLSGLPMSWVCQHLDDIVGAAPADSSKLFEFDDTFQAVAGRLGVKLAPRNDPEKSFAPGKEGVVFGVWYSTTDWVWAIPQNKLIGLVKVIRSAVDKGHVKAKEAKSLVGKIINIKSLVPTGRFNVHHIMALGAEANRAAAAGQVLEVSQDCRQQLEFWHLMLIACNHKVAIPRLPVRQPVWALQAFCDAAGGSMDALGRGTGGVLGDWWYYIPWAKRVCSGGWKVDGIKVGRKLSALELVGPLVFVAAAHKLVRGRHLTVWVDNAGSVAIWQKGYSGNCRLSTAIVTATSAVAAALGCTLDIQKISRCSNTPAKMADCLSKAEFVECRRIASEAGWRLQTEPGRVPVALLAWLERPVPEEGLALSILKEIAVGSPVLGVSVP